MVGAASYAGHYFHPLSIPAGLSLPARLPGTHTQKNFYFVALKNGWEELFIESDKQRLPVR